MTPQEAQMNDALRALEGRDWYKFGELSEAAQKKAVEDYVVNSDIQIGTEHEEEILAELGVEYVAIAYSMHSGSGDGAGFTGDYSYSKVVNNTGKYPPDVLTELRPLYKKLIALQRRCQWKLCACIKRRSSRYSNEYSVDIHPYHADGDPVPDDIASDLADTLRDFMRWVSRSLDKEYAYQTGEGAIEFLRNCDEFYTYTVDGEEL